MGSGGRQRSCCRQHGVFTIGATATAAVKTAVMVEDIAATVWAALQIGAPEPLDDDLVERLHHRYTTAYGQPTVQAVGVPEMRELDTFEVWFVTGSQHLYGPATLELVARQAAEVAAALDASAAIGVRVVAKPVVTDADGIRRVCQEANAAPACVGVITWMHTFSPAKMWIAGLSALQRPLLHLHTQYHGEIPWDGIDMDFMNLNQAAHGDREFGFMAARMRLERKVVVGHWTDPEVGDRIGVWASAACAKRDWEVGRIARFGDNMRDVAVTDGDKVEAQRRLGFSVDTFGVGDLVALVDADLRCRGRRARRPVPG